MKKNHKLQITKETAHELHELARISERKETSITTKGGHGLHKDSFGLQTMTALNKKFLRGVQGGSFFKKRPPGRRRQEDEEPPPVLGSWRNLYILVLGNLLFWIALFTLFTWIFK